MLDEEVADGGNQAGRKFAIVLAIVGLVLIGVGVVLTISHQPVPENHPLRSRAQTLPATKTFQHGLLLLALIVAIFAVATAAFLRWSRHFRRQLLRRPAPPTAVEDVWTMHRLPDEDEQGPSEEAEGPGSEGHP